jgi:dTDP-4-amino-4,6-dideoxygalactose transaminase
LRTICAEHGLKLIEDASQAHGASLAGQLTGSNGTTTFSFYPSKNMTTSEGGMLTTDDQRVADAARRLRSHGERAAYEHVDLGFNYRMTNIAAAIGIEQLKRLPELNARRIANAGFLDRALSGIQTPRRRPQVTHVFHQYTLRVPAQRDEFMKQLRARGVESRVYYPLAIHQQPLYRKLGYDAVSLPEAERAAAEVVSIPVHPSLSQADLERVANAVREVAAVLA